MNNKRKSRKSPLRYMNNKQHIYATQRKSLQSNNKPQNNNRYNSSQQKLHNLTETVLNVFQEYNIQYTPQYNEIYQIIQKDPPVNWNPDSILRIIKTVRQYYENKQEKLMPYKIEPLSQFDQQDEIKPSNVSIHPVLDLKLNKMEGMGNIIPSNRVLDNNINPIVLPPPQDGGFTPPHKPEELMDTSLEYWEHILIIDSKDRDLERFVTPNNFTIDLSPDAYTSTTERKGYIKRGFHNVVSAEVIGCMFLDTSSEGDSSDTTSPPAYVILEIPELSSNVHGTNDELSNAFDILTTYSAQGNYKYYKLPNNLGPMSIVKKYEPRITLAKLTIRYKLPDGSYYNFGSDNNGNATTVNKVIIKIKQLKHRITTTFLHKENS
jgi:hypothetical protein